MVSTALVREGDHYDDLTPEPHQVIRLLTGLNIHQTDVDQASIVDHFTEAYYGVMEWSVGTPLTTKRRGALQQVRLWMVGASDRPAAALIHFEPENARATMNHHVLHEDIMVRAGLSTSWSDRSACGLDLDQALAKIKDIWVRTWSAIDEVLRCSPAAPDHLERVKQLESILEVVQHLMHGHFRPLF